MKYISDFVFTGYGIVATIALLSLLKIIRRSPEAQRHGRWATAYAVAICLGLPSQVYYDLRLLVHLHQPAWVTLTLYFLSWVNISLWLYGHVQLFKAFRDISRSRASSFKDFPLEEWPAATAPTATNLWANSQPGTQP